MALFTILAVLSVQNAVDAPSTVLVSRFAAVWQYKQRRRSRTYSDPVEYCRAVGTSDQPGPQYRGPRTAPSLLRAARLSRIQADLLAWRCMDRTVYVCAQLSSTACDQAPWLNPRRWDYVLRNPDVRAECRRVNFAQCASGTHCIVGCAGGQPRVNGPSWRTDARGYAPEEWTPVR
jgi:hypothetical protein